MKNKVSVIIPIYKEGRNIEKILNMLIYKSEFYEIIVVDSSRDEVSREVVEKYRLDNILYIESKKGRGIQLNEGSRIAKGDVLLFLHCDSRVEDDIIKKIDNAIEKGVEFGCMKIKFDSDRILMKICSNMSNLRVRYRKIAFGDQGMFFTRKCFETLGGFRDIGLMEDYDISIRAKKVCRLHQISSVITTSSRRFYPKPYRKRNLLIQDLYALKIMCRMQRYQYEFRRGVAVETIEKKYNRR